jgi:hypothetical protein
MWTDVSKEHFAPYSGSKIIRARNQRVTRFSETSAHIRTTWRYNPENDKIQNWHMILFIIRFSPFYYGEVLQSTPLPALASQHTNCWLYLNVCIQIVNKLGNLTKIYIYNDTSTEHRDTTRGSCMECFVVSVYTTLRVKKKLNSMVWVRERTIPTERPALVGEVIANFCR